ncbi:class C beta-lactamase [uncultured Methylibium sp.]|uniref:class C beta-lactamase n=1 Tax=uncultured Methylibium sp. TaxID=381093 RepID=UPI0025DBEFB6|nr:class C beta-lactamase [uncultured Methylibium sp.]
MLPLHPSPGHPRRRALAVLLALLAPLPSGAGDDAETLRAIVDEAIRPLMARHDIPGMAVGLVVDGRARVFNYGVSSRQSRAPVTDTTLFEIGSISKMFTTTLAAWAQANGKLSLDDHPGRHLPHLKGRPIDRATLLHLGSYTAGGLPLQFPDAVASDEAALAYFRAWKADAPPGTLRQYSNPSIGLLGAVTAKALGDGYATLIKTRLLPQFGMRHTYIHVPPQAMADYAWGDRDGQPVRVNPGPLDDETYGIKSTAADLLRFVQAHIDPRGLEPPLRRAIAVTQVGRYRVGSMVQGFGWEQFAYPVSREALLGGNAEEVIFEPNPVQRVAPQPADAPRLFDKTGSTGGFGAYVAFVPTQRIGIVILANRSYPIPARVEAAHAILDRLAPGTR